MYVCTFKEQLEVRGESLQEGANPLIGRTATTIQLLPLSNSRRLQTPHPRAGRPLKRQRKKATVDPAAPLRHAATPHSLGKASVPTGSWPFQNLVPKSVFLREDCGTTEMESAQLLERQKAKFPRSQVTPTLFGTTNRSSATGLRLGQQSGCWNSLQESCRSVT